MKTLAQIRADNALKAAKKPGMGLGKEGGDALSGFPMLIKMDGLLAALAFAIERKSENSRKHPGAFLIANAIAEHLSNKKIGIASSTNADDLVKELANDPDDSKLRRATAETLAYINYLKRFVV